MLEIETEGDEKGGVAAALAFNLEEDAVGAIVLGDSSGIKEGALVRPTGRVLSVRVGKEMVGRVVDALGNPLDNAGSIFDANSEEVFYPVEKKAPVVLARESVNTPLHTGIKAIDAIIPIGRGQRELIIGDRGLGKTAIALDT